MIEVAVTVFLVLICVAIALVWPQKKPQPVPATPDPVLVNKPNTELARKVWAAHTANQTLDMALLTGSPAQIRDAEAKAAVANSHLVAYLTEKANQ